VKGAVDLREWGCSHDKHQSVVDGISGPWLEQDETEVGILALPLLPSNYHCVLQSQGTEYLQKKNNLSMPNSLNTT
jgi:hypothetical protein